MEQKNIKNLMNKKKFSIVDIINIFSFYEFYEIFNSWKFSPAQMLSAGFYFSRWPINNNNF